MLVYLDARDLINIFEKSKPCSANEFQAQLETGKHELVLSFSNVLEIAAPLLERSAQSNVMKLLNRVEAMPVKFIKEARISFLELEEALKAFLEQREYSNIWPFVNRFDEAIPIDGLPSTRYFLTFGLSETVFTLWREAPGILRGYKNYGNELRHRFARDRSLLRPPSLQSNFIKTIQRDLSLYKLLQPAEGVDAFAKWIYKAPSRCPSLRLLYDTYHKMLMNEKYIPEDNDMEDFNHVRCLPYVDFMTLDRTMHSYVSQASIGLGIGYEKRVVKSVQEVLAALKA